MNRSQSSSSITNQFSSQFQFDTKSKSQSHSNSSFNINNSTKMSSQQNPNHNNINNTKNGHQKLSNTNNKLNSRKSRKRHFKQLFEDMQFDSNANSTSPITANSNSISDSFVYLYQPPRKKHISNKKFTQTRKIGNLNQDNVISWKTNTNTNTNTNGNGNGFQFSGFGNVNSMALMNSSNQNNNKSCKKSKNDESKSDVIVINGKRKYVYGKKTNRPPRLNPSFSMVSNQGSMNLNMSTKEYQQFVNQQYIDFVANRNKQRKTQQNDNKSDKDLDSMEFD